MGVGELEAFGQLATAGLAAQAVDPTAGDAGHRHYVCRNCGAALNGKFCHSCGQAGHVHRSIGHVAHEFLHGITHLDGKAARTLPKLLLDPGGLTFDYVHGKRTRYIAPVALFLMCVFLMFFVFGFTGGPTLNIPGNLDSRPLTKAQAQARLPELTKAVADFDKGIAESKGEGAPTVTIGVFTDKARAALVRERDRVAAIAAGKTPAPAPKTEAQEADWATALRKGVESGEINIQTPTPEMTAKVRHALLNPEFTFYKIQQKAYKLSFLLVPLSLPWLWLMFAWRRGHTLYDHSVFILYSLSFMSLLLIGATLLGIAGVESGWVYGLLLVVAPIVHIFMQLKGAYRLGNGSAAWRTAVLSTIAFLTLATFCVAILMLGLVE